MQYSWFVFAATTPSLKTINNISPQNNQDVGCRHLAHYPAGFRCLTGPNNVLIFFYFAFHVCAILLTSSSTGCPYFLVQIEINFRMLYLLKKTMHTYIHIYVYNFIHYYLYELSECKESKFLYMFFKLFFKNTMFQSLLWIISTYYIWQVVPTSWLHWLSLWYKMD